MLQAIILTFIAAYIAVQWLKDVKKAVDAASDRSNGR